MPWEADKLIVSNPSQTLPLKFPTVQFRNRDWVPLHQVGVEPFHVDVEESSVEQVMLSLKDKIKESTSSNLLHSPWLKKGIPTKTKKRRLADNYGRAATEVKGDKPHNHEK